MEHGLRYEIVLDMMLNLMFKIFVDLCFQIVVLLEEQHFVIPLLPLFL